MTCARIQTKSFPPVPDDLRGRARTVGNGEVFWPLSVASSAAEAIASAGMAICGGEIYVAQGRAWGNLELEWATEPGSDGNENWVDYVKRGLAQALFALNRASALFDHGDAIDSAGSEPMCFLAIYNAGDLRG